MSDLKKAVKKLCDVNEKLKVETERDLQYLTRKISHTTEGVNLNSKRIQEYNEVLRHSDSIHAQTAHEISNRLQALSQTITTLQDPDPELSHTIDNFMGSMEAHVKAMRDTEDSPRDISRQIRACVKKFDKYCRQSGTMDRDIWKRQKIILDNIEEQTVNLHSWETLLFDTARSISNQLQGLSGSLGQLEREGRTLTFCQRLLKRLRYSDIDSRKRNIQTAHTKTFEWIFSEVQGDGENHSDAHRFALWLREGKKPFWIQGKAGSGKSTLMKFIVGHSETKKYLQDWAGEKELVIASYYFWNLGTRLEKSQEGLLRSILFDIFRKCPELVLPVREKVDFLDDLEGTEESWSFDELLTIYKAILEKNIRSRKFCFFVDGLDEFQDASHSNRDLLRTLRDLTTSNDIKLCVSSRPWSEFDDEFGDGKSWSFKLQDLTENDIRQVVEDQFNAHPQFKTLWKSEPEYYDLIEQVVSKSQGVFLWVHLVLRSLLDGLTYNDSVKILQERLEAFPEDLDQFFKHMVNSIPRIYLPRAARMFKIAVAAERPLSLMFYSVLQELEEGGNLTIDQPIYGMPTSEFAKRKKRMRRLLDGRSRGLLEVTCDTEGDGASAFLEVKVDFLHRTVRDFLGDSDLEFLHQDVYCDEAELYLMSCKAALAMMRRVPIGLRQPMVVWGPLFDLFFFFSNKASSHPGTLDALRDLLSRVEVTFNWMIETRCFRGSVTPNYILSYASRYHVDFYVQWKLSQTWYPASLLRHPECPALDYALSGPRPALDTVRLLLRYGADPNQAYRGSTVWARFISGLVRSPEKEHLRSMHRSKADDLEEDFEVVKCLLLAGARLNEELRFGSAMSTALAVIKRHFPAPQATILLTCRPSWTRTVMKAFWGGNLNN